MTINLKDILSRAVMKVGFAQSDVSLVPEDQTENRELKYHIKRYQASKDVFISIIKGEVRYRYKIKLTVRNDLGLTVYDDDRLSHKDDIEKTVEEMFALYHTINRAENVKL